MHQADPYTTTRSLPSLLSGMLLWGNFLPPRLSVLMNALVCTCLTWPQRMCSCAQFGVCGAARLAAALG